jgi:hypothetical protein
MLGGLITFSLWPPPSTTEFTFFSFLVLFAVARSFLNLASSAKSPGVRLWPFCISRSFFKMRNCRYDASWWENRESRSLKIRRIGWLGHAGHLIISFSNLSFMNRKKYTLYNCRVFMLSHFNLTNEAWNAVMNSSTWTWRESMLYHGLLKLEDGSLRQFLCRLPFFLLL